MSQGRGLRAQAAPGGTGDSAEYGQYEADPPAPPGTTWITKPIDQTHRRSA
ncbi:hypothetical protein GCM10027199_24760 [Amycolatopsis magusensis]